MTFFKKVMKLSEFPHSDGYASSVNSITYVVMTPWLRYVCALNHVCCLHAYICICKHLSGLEVDSFMTLHPIHKTQSPCTWWWLWAVGSELWSLSHGHGYKHGRHHSLSSDRMDVRQLKLQAFIVSVDNSFFFYFQ